MTHDTGNRRRAGPRHWLAAMLALAMLPALATTAGAQTGNDGFLTTISGGALHEVVVDGHGKILIGGQFTAGGNTRRLARLRPDGSGDPTFTLSGLSATAGRVSSILPLGSGYLVGGTFTGGTSPDYLAWLGPNGGLMPGLPVTVNGAVFKVAPRYTSNGYFVAGQFTWVNGATRHGLARLTGSLALDTGFAPPPFSGNIQDVIELPDGKVLVAGAFLNISGNPGAGYAVFRLHADGSLDTSFNFDSVPHGIEHVVAMALQPDGKLLIAGNFTATAGSQERRRIARLDSDGSLDLGFQGPTLNGMVTDMVVQPDRRIVITGDFTGVGLANRIARLHADGAVDTTLAPLMDPDNVVRAVALQGDGGILFAGDFTSYTGGIPARRLARIPPTSFFDRDFAPPAPIDGDILALAVLANGDVLAGGGFTSIGGQPRTNLARFSGATGSLATTFTPTLNGAVHAIIVQPDGKILIGGEFQLVNGSTRRHIARFNGDGSLDAGFMPANIAGGIVQALELGPDGTIYVGGSFQTVAGQARAHLVRLLANGQVDSAFEDRGVDGTVRAIAMAGDNHRLYIGGDFTTVDGVQQWKLARLWPNGLLNTGFRGQTSASSNRIHALAVPPDGLGVIVGGVFSGVRRANGTAVTRLNLARFLDDGTVDTGFGGQTGTPGLGPNGTVMAMHASHDEWLYLGGTFSQVAGSPHPNLARVDMAQGRADSAFDAAAVMPGTALPAWVNTLALQGDGRLLVGGHFGMLGGVSRPHLGRLGNRLRLPAETIAFSPSADTVTWQRSEAGVGVRGAPQLLLSTTCCSTSAFEPLPGLMTWSPLAGGHWRYHGFPSVEGVFYLRVQARIGDGTGTGLYHSPIHRFEGNTVPELAADLAVAKTVQPPQALPGAQVVFTISVDNLGPDPASHVQVHDLLPAGYSYLSHLAGYGSYNPLTGLWDIGTMSATGAGGGHTLTVTATVNATGPLVNTAVVSSALPDPDPGNNTASAQVLRLADDTLFADGFEGL